MCNILLLDLDELKKSIAEAKDTEFSRKQKSISFIDGVESILIKYHTIINYIKTVNTDSLAMACLIFTGSNDSVQWLEELLERLQLYHGKSINLF